MLIVQVAISFAIWILFGWMQSRRTAKWRSILGSMSRKTRTVLGPILMLLGASALLGGGFLTLSIHGLNHDSLTLAGWLCVTVVGLLFVGCQMVAALLMFSLATEAAGSQQPSDQRINDRN